jgi:Domain of unknown function (DUF4907)
MKSLIRMTRGKYYIFLFPVLLLIIGIPTIHYFKNKKKDRESVFVQVNPIQTSYGWGYNILADGKIYIHQEFVPALPGKQSFKSKDEALKVGHKVLSKITANQLPTITVEELKQMGIVKDTTVLR